MRLVCLARPPTDTPADADGRFDAASGPCKKKLSHVWIYSLVPSVLCPWQPIHNKWAQTELSTMNLAGACLLDPVLVPALLSARIILRPAGSSIVRFKGQGFGHNWSITNVIDMPKEQDTCTSQSVTIMLNHIEYWRRRPPCIPALCINLGEGRCHHFV